jgi:hypothetical protein
VCACPDLVADLVVAVRHLDSRFKLQPVLENL